MILESIDESLVGLRFAAPCPGLFPEWEKNVLPSRAATAKNEGKGPAPLAVTAWVVE